MNIFKKVYEKVSMIPITLLVFAGIYEMFIGDLIRGVINGNVSWMIPVTQSMIIDTVITLLVIYFLMNGFPKSYKMLSNNKNTKWISTLILLMFVLTAIILFIVGQLFLGKTLFYLNYLVFMGILFILCILQKIIENMILNNKYEKKA